MGLRVVLSTYIWGPLGGGVSFGTAGMTGVMKLITFVAHLKSYDNIQLILEEKRKLSFHSCLYHITDLAHLNHVRLSLPTPTIKSTNVTKLQATFYITSIVK